MPKRKPLTLEELQRRELVNGRQVDGWLWRARHAVRRRNARLALEATLAALWLLGAADFERLR